MTLEHLFAAARQFTPCGQFEGVRVYGRGNVHDTFLVTTGRACASSDCPGGQHFILQRLNTRVFNRPEAVMGNIRLVTEHVRRRMEQNSPGASRRFQLPRLLLTKEGQDRWIDPGGSFWRALSYIEAARAFDTLLDLNQGREVGRALGLFHDLVSDFPPAGLADTLPGFHETPGYLRDYDEVLGQRPIPRSSDVNYCLQFVEERRSWAGVLEEAKARGRLRPRVIHGDPKVNNVLLDEATGQAVSLIDLDTVKPGLVHYDLGDCLRSGCNPLGEETVQWEAVRFDPDLCRAVLQGYLFQAEAFLTEGDYEYIYDAVRLIAFELGLRFFTDYLEGNVYFKACHPEHNLARAMVQFKLTESIESQEKVIRAIMRDLK
jgi:Ser/Thr protein kinase RdoA (MazF antagonist)